MRERYGAPPLRSGSEDVNGRGARFETGGADTYIR
jgi:hypothetical protein